MSVAQSTAELGKESELEGFDDLDMHSMNENPRRSETDGLARKETKAVSWLRILVVLVLLATAVAVSVVTFLYLKRTEDNNFETAYYDQAARVIDAIRIKTDLRVGTIRAFAESLTSHASFHKSEWPLVTLPDFERQGTASASLADVMSMILVPIVTDATKDRWETYSVQNQGWLQEGLKVQQEEEGRKGQVQITVGVDSLDDLKIPELIHRVDGLTPAAERGPGPFLPQWQIAPVVPVPALVNFNLLSHPSYMESLSAMLRIEGPVVGRSFDFSDTNDYLTIGRRDIFELFLQKWQEDKFYGDDPVADLQWPIFDSFDENEAKLVGLLTCVIYWRTYFEDLLAENVVLDIVLDNTCGQVYTYQINGPDVEYLGSGDKHNRKFDRFKVATAQGAYLRGDTKTRNTEGSCLYSIQVYPAEQFEEVYVTGNPAIYTTILVLIFIFTSAVFVIYDCLVERRQRVVMDTAVASSAIVSSLFPRSVRDRLYKNDHSINNGDVLDENPTGQTSADSTLLKEGPVIVDGTECGPAPSRSIADLFQNCTVLFADIPGFTLWSSGREPSDIFFLLEKIYGEFDVAARKHRVFKVETIGDCYLAVTGLPEPQAQHAVIMSLFAHDCLRRVKLLLAKELRITLGSDTSSLALRFGLHSGPVTAGVLRGEKSRFQLFGDTVNTASRMESTGHRNTIQLSLQTADCLVQAKKGHWLEERADKVDAKGKGTLQTFWLNPRAYQPSRDGDRVAAMMASAMKRGMSTMSIDEMSETEELPGENSIMQTNLGGSLQSDREEPSAFARRGSINTNSDDSLKLTAEPIREDDEVEDGASSTEHVHASGHNGSSVIEDLVSDDVSTSKLLVNPQDATLPLDKQSQL